METYVQLSTILDGGLEHILSFFFETLGIRDINIFHSTDTGKNLGDSYLFFLNISLILQSALMKIKGG